MEKERIKVSPGVRVGKLTVTAPTKDRKNGYTIWECACDCGGSIRLDTRTLQRGTVTDCGCVSAVKPGQRDITGERFGMLTAIAPVRVDRKIGSVVWHCKCDCGGEIDAPLSQLRSGYRKSCGCLSHPPLKDWIGKRFGKLTVTGYAGKENGMHRWECVCDCGKQAVARQSDLLQGKTRSCGCLQNEIILENLKLIGGTSVTQLESCLKRVNRNNTSGCTGVYYNKKRGKWVAEIRFRGQHYNLGLYRDKQDAIKARRRGEEMHEDFIRWYYDEYVPSLNEIPPTAAEKAAVVGI